jgi:uncharacterized phage-associated protein
MFIVLKYKKINMKSPKSIIKSKKVQKIKAALRLSQERLLDRFLESIKLSYGVYIKLLRQAP